ncbi:MAG: PAS domain-containing protein [Bacteroidetes bacterium]|jgi:two-component system, sensor histidine kinase and response regulator|nr:PAS domain-containing protein [Bacteroidota bacterium]MBT5530530.1 PAS domain-containing protein [Cytophagia bacterium]MBT3422385.1 PAS domain-containing protein [Bacteroidota bacterium]MBT3934645.1 PAS domain-containing protein [Bacteroidota bacterium]MBT4336953.1 PAS domain-containing protein [Bacteroidota bacterium]
MEDLKSSKLFVEEIINAIPVRVFWKDKDLVYLGCNTAFANDAGLSDPEDIIGKDDFQMVWKQQAEQYKNDDLQVINSGLSKKNIEETQDTPEGNTLTLLTNKIPLFDLEKNVCGVIGSYVDITHLKQVEDDLNNHRLNLEEIVAERTKDLNEKNKELDRYNQLFEGREFRIKELRDIIKELERRLENI